MGIAERPLSESQARATAILEKLTPELRGECIRLARNRTPSGVVADVRLLATRAGFYQFDAEDIVKATRWLAVIRRDYPESVFEETVRGIAAPLRPWVLASGEMVTDREPSHIHGNVGVLLPDVFAGITSAGREQITHSHDFGRAVGTTSCIETSSRDVIVYAQRPNRRGLTRFAKNRQPLPCSWVTVVLRWHAEKQCYEIATAFVGTQAQPEVWDKWATDLSSPFWNSHALVWGSEETIPGTETPQCPWK